MSNLNLENYQRNIQDWLLNYRLLDQGYLRVTAIKNMKPHEYYKYEPELKIDEETEYEDIKF